VYSLKGNVLFKTARESIHFLRKPPAIAIDLEIFNSKKDLIEYVQVYEKEGGFYYTARKIDFIKFGIYLDRGYGKQIALPLKYWDKSKIPDIVPEAFNYIETEKEKKKINQLSLGGIL
jgi:hypothetical protein